MAENNNTGDKPSDGSPKSEDDLESLLNSALNDFTEAPKKNAGGNKSENISNPTEDEKEQAWSKMIHQALEMDPNIRDLLSGNEENQIAKDFSKIAEAAAKMMESDTPVNFADVMAETLRNLNENSDSMQNQFGNPEELANLFQSMGMGGAVAEGDGGVDDIPPYLQNIMQSFLSKEILYPPMKDFVERYPVWLEEHKESLTSDQHNNYSKQLEIMTKVVEEFEQESESDSDNTKKQRFQKIMAYMQQMQALGHPPADLIGDDFLHDDSALPSLPPGLDPSQCSIM